MSKDVEEIYRSVNGVRHFTALTTVNEVHIRSALSALREDVSAEDFADLSDRVRRLDGEGAAKLLGTSYEIAAEVRRVIEAV